jgi:cyclic pyranopterin phosphate synthase
MPMGDDMADHRPAQYWPLDDVRARLTERYGAQDLPLRTGGPARYMRLNATGQTVGFITPMTHNFCESCNRVRLTCTGQLYMCLGQNDMADLRAPLRASDDDSALSAAIRAAIARKPKGHDFDYTRLSPAGRVSGQMPRHMSHTGG